MNFFKNLFQFLFHKNHTLTKKLHTLGFVVVTTCIISIFLLGVNGYASTTYSYNNQDEQVKIAKENEALELEELIKEEEDIVSSYILQDQETIQKYIDYYQLRLSKIQEVRRTPMRMDEPSVALSTSSMDKESLPKVAYRDEILISESDYEVLIRIVEAEVGAEDLYCRSFIANIIINRMLHDYYPDTIEEVVFQNDGNVYQFSPIKDKRYYKVEASDETIQAVEIALAGYDNSGGALAFVNRSQTSDKIMSWFDNNLVYVAQYGVVEFFTF